MRIILIALLWFFPSLAHEYLYPVGVSPKQERIYVLYQKAAAHLELWEWDYTSGYANQLLLSRYSPAGFKLLPDESGFSFVDNGMLKVKQFIKRSPRNISFDAPIYQVELVHWIDPTTCYAAGRYNDYSGIFQIDWNGVIQPLVYQNGVDALYPQKVENQLYYIERTEHGRYGLMHTHYQTTTDADEEWHDRIASCQRQVQGLIDFKAQPVAFLQMVSDSEGFAIGYPLAVSKKDQSIAFKYFHLFKTHYQWNYEELFSFLIPTELLVLGSNHRLYESILPLIPRVCQNNINFVDSSSTGFLALKSFNRATGEIEQCMEKVTQHYFSTCLFEDKIIYGGQLGGGVELLDGAQILLGQLNNK